MKIKTVHYLATINLGNYSNEKIGFAADVEDGETPEEAVEALRKKAQECALPNCENTYEAIYKAQSELRDLERKLNKSRSEWNATAEFLRAQGIKADAANMPSFTNLLPGIAEEHVAEAEIEDGMF